MGKGAIEWDKIARHMRHQCDAQTVFGCFPREGAVKGAISLVVRKAFGHLKAIIVDELKIQFWFSGFGCKVKCVWRCLRILRF